MIKVYTDGSCIGNQGNGGWAAIIIIDGKNTDNIEISDKIFSGKPSKNIVQSLLYWRLNKFKKRNSQLL